MSAADHIFKLRSYMAQNGLHAYIITGSDPHLSEYLADHWKFRDWLCGFTGSAGTLVVTNEEAGLWTDSRYFLQAEQQLEDSGVELFRMGEPQTADYKDWLCVQLNSGSTVGINGRTITVSAYRKLAKTLKKSDIRLDGKVGLEEDVWEGRPKLPEEGIFELDTVYCGLGRREKIALIRQEMKALGTTHYIITALDEIAWTLNFRGRDIPYNPVFYAYLIITEDQINLFIDPHKMTSAIGKQLSDEEIKVYAYDDYYSFLKDMLPDSIIWVDPERVNSTTFSHLPPQSAKIERSSLITQLKAIRNKTEIHNIRKAMVKDGVAMVKFLYWLSQNIESRQDLNEFNVTLELTRFRSQQENYQGDSFNPISGYGPNGAIVHYAVNEETALPLEAEGFYLIDSGGQYFEGTTDITRTIAMGPLNAEQKKDFTLVLKGNIALDMAIFPQGTRGVHLDTLARQALWCEGLNYGHGTGHGVGHFLNVHEGPQAIRPQDNGIELKPGMITSNEPGLYKTGQYGIRIENLILCVPCKQTDYGTFLKFETLTLCPIDIQALDSSLLTEVERNWLNQYHEKVQKELMPYLDEKEKEWLRNQTQRV